MDARNGINHFELGNLKKQKKEKEKKKPTRSLTCPNKQTWRNHSHRSRQHSVAVTLHTGIQPQRIRVLDPPLVSHIVARKRARPSPSVFHPIVTRARSLLATESIPVRSHATRLGSEGEAGGAETSEASDGESSVRSEWSAAPSRRGRHKNG